MTQLSSKNSMQQAVSPASPAAGRSVTHKTQPPTREQLPGLPRTGLTPQQQLEALARVQNQAEQRVRLGLQLFKAAEAHTSTHRQLLDQITEEREKFRDELSKDVTSSLHTFDQWIGQMDDTFSQAFLTLDERMDAVEMKLEKGQQRLETMLNQAQKLLDQAMSLLNSQAASAPQHRSAPPMESVPAVQQVSPARTLTVTKPVIVEAQAAAPVPQTPEAGQAPVTPEVEADASGQQGKRSVSYSDILSRIGQDRPTKL